jgi:hypothetical protein
MGPPEKISPGPRKFSRRPWFVFCPTDFFWKRLFLRYVNMNPLTKISYRNSYRKNSYRNSYRKNSYRNSYRKKSYRNFVRNSYRNFSYRNSYRNLMGKIPIRIDNSYYRLIFYLDKKDQIYHYCSKEHPIISKIAKFGCKML